MEKIPSSSIMIVLLFGLVHYLCTSRVWYSGKVFAEWEIHGVFKCFEIHVRLISKAYTEKLVFPLGPSSDGGVHVRDR